MDPLPLTRDIVLIGGGHAHALVLRRWGMQPLPGARLTVIDPSPQAAYSGMLPGFVAGHYGRDDLDIDLVRLTRFAGARLITGAASGIDLTEQTVTVEGRPPLAFDVASIDIGITSAMPALPGFSEHGVPAKPLGPFSHRWAALREAAPAPRIVVLGGGVAGAELAMAMAHATGGQGASISLIDKGKALADLAPQARRLILKEMAALGIDLHEHTTVAEVGPDHVALSDGRRIASDFTLGAAGAQAHPWLAETGLVLEDGFIRVDSDLRTSNPHVFACGDCAHLTHAPRPKAGVYAVRQAPVLFDNLCAAVSGGTLRPYRPQRDYLKLISLGGKKALAQKWGMVRSGASLWRLKDGIDRRFMDKLRDLPAMEEASLPMTRAEGLEELVGNGPACGGCGSKLGRQALGAGLSGLSFTRPDVDRLAGDDAALVTVGGARQVLTTDHLRAVTDDPVLMTRIAAIHALGDIWAMGAEPQAALVSVVLPRMSPRLQSRTLTEIMQAAEAVLGAAGAAIAGGHSSQGHELTIGFSLTGLLTRTPITMAGAKAGDALILTKGIGSGVILAAEMRGLARGRDVVACHAAMLQEQGTAADILQGAHAMTDVTGFGLAGHLSGLCEASGLGARLEAGAIPVLEGALALAEGGIRSTLWEDNRAAVPHILGATGPLGDLLFDPQTCGGLLAAVPETEATTLCSALRDRGYPAAIIGRMTQEPGIILD